MKSLAENGRGRRWSEREEGRKEGREKSSLSLSFSGTSWSLLRSQDSRDMAFTISDEGSVLYSKLERDQV